MYNCLQVFLALKMQKIKLLPSSKEKKRYLVYELFEDTTHENILKTANQTLGLFDAAKAGLQLLKHKAKRGILRVNTKYVDKLKTTLIINHNLQTIYVSGILNKAIQKLNG